MIYWVENKNKEKRNYQSAFHQGLSTDAYLPPPYFLREKGETRTFFFNYFFTVLSFFWIFLISFFNNLLFHHSFIQWNSHII